MRASFGVYFKILFAIQMAILPMIAFGQLILPIWLPLLFLVLAIVARVWSVAYFNKTKTSHHILMQVSGGALLTFCLFYMAILGGLPWWIVISASIVGIAFFTLQFFVKSMLKTDVQLALEFSYSFFNYVGILLIFISFATNFWSQACLMSSMIVGAMMVLFYMYKIIKTFPKKKLFNIKRK